MTKYDVAIIGAGVVGGLIARKLSQYQLSICLLEKEDDVAMGATRANSAIVHGGFDPEVGTLKAKLNVRGTELMPDICRELDVHYKNNGSIVVAFDNEQLDCIKALYQRGLDNGVPADTLSLLSGDEAKALEPNLSPNVVGALRCTFSGIVCPYELTIAAVGNAMDNGATLKCNFEVTDICDCGNFYTISSAGGDRIQARYVVNCAGLYADTIAAIIGDHYHVIAKKGEYLLFDKSEGSLVSHTIFQAPSQQGKGILVTPTVDGNMLIGPTAPVVEKTDNATTAEGLNMVRTVAAKSVAPGCLNFRKVITSFAGVRSACAESKDFVIEISAHSPHFINTIGIESPGLSAAPAIAEYVEELLKKAGLVLTPDPAFDGRRVSPRRFSLLSDDEKNEMIRRDPSYGHVICRCETVTEGQILAAIRQNPPARDVDAVKRRTRSSMGRCQGGFCTPFITELLARERKIPEENVTKFGGESYLLAGKKD